MEEQVAENIMDAIFSGIKNAVAIVSYEDAYNALKSRFANKTYEELLSNPLPLDIIQEYFTLVNMLNKVPNDTKSCDELLKAVESANQIKKKGVLLG